MTRVLRADKRYWLNCDGERDCVPAMGLHRTDKVGYLTEDQMSESGPHSGTVLNWHRLSKGHSSTNPLLLMRVRKIITNGGWRYQPMDPGYRIHRK